VQPDLELWRLNWSFLSSSEWWHELWILQKDSLISVAINLRATQLEALKIEPVAYVAIVLSFALFFVLLIP
jgi:hypothetical protein